MPEETLHIVNFSGGLCSFWAAAVSESYRTFVPTKKNPHHGPGLLIHTVPAILTALAAKAKKPPATFTDRERNMAEEVLRNSEADQESIEWATGVLNLDRQAS